MAFPGFSRAEVAQGFIYLRTTSFVSLLGRSSALAHAHGWLWKEAGKQALLLLEGRVSSHELLMAGMCSLHSIVHTGKQLLILGFPKETPSPQCVPH